MRNPAPRSTVRALWWLAPLWSSSLAGQQISDPNFNASVENPAYTREGPIVAIDEAHGNFHTADGRYKPAGAQPDCYESSLLAGMRLSFAPIREAFKA